MAKSPSLKTAVKKAVTKAATEAKTGNVATVPETKGGPEQAARDGDLGPWREEQARLANTTDLPTGARRGHPPN